MARSRASCAPRDLAIPLTLVAAAASTRAGADEPRPPCRSRRSCAKILWISRLAEEESMALKVRRVVTGHDAEGRAIVSIDEVSQNLRSARPGAQACVVWTSKGFPIENTGDKDEGLGGTRPTQG